jgi:ABC-type bacteriocin/lantibiotic exporter with double-glycine peptidase domain
MLTRKMQIQAIANALAPDVDVPEKTLARATRTTEGGTSPKDIARVSGGRVRDRMPIGQLKRLTDAGTPVIAAYQDGPADSDSNGHYSVVDKVDENVQLSDPSSKKPLRKIPTEQFASRWHDVDKDGHERERLGVVVESKEKLTKISKAGGAFSSELRKLAYDTAPNRVLIGRLLEAVMKPRITSDDRRAILEAARRISETSDPRIRLLARLRGR